MSSINSKLSNAETGPPAPNPCPVFPSSIFVPNSRHSIDLGTTSQSVNQLLSSRIIHVPYPANANNGAQSGLKGLMMSQSGQRATAAINSPRYANKNSHKIQFNEHFSGNINKSLLTHHHVCRSRLSLDLNSPSSADQQHAIAHLLGKQPQSNSPATTPTGNGHTATTAAMPIPVKNGGTAAAGTGNNGGVIISPRYKEFKTYSSTFDGLQALEQSQPSANGGAATNGIHSDARDVEEPQHMVRIVPGRFHACR